MSYAFIILGNPCGDYGLTLGNGTRVCEEGHIYKSLLPAGGTIDVTLWYTRLTADFRLSCYAWCEAGEGVDDGHVHDGRPADADHHMGEITGHLVNRNIYASGDVSLVSFL